jgi:3'-phosphoadenosine 5'-phosphosulfate sulfotransferase (PAPS reductase)/FAD synthetase
MAPYLHDTPTQTLQPYTKCCGEMLWRPMMDYIDRNKVKWVFRGSKECDTRVGVGPRHVENGVTFDSPLWHWSDQDVYDYLDEIGVTLPDHYASINDSIDCWCCTAHLAHHGDEKMRYIRTAYPELWPKVRERMGRVNAVLTGELARVAGALEEAA